MPEYEVEFRNYVQSEIRRSTDSVETLKTLIRQKRFKELEIMFGDLATAFRKYNEIKTKRDYFKKVHFNLWGEFYDPPVGWKE